MRLVTLGMILCLTIPTWGAAKKAPREVCGDRCESDYQFCQTRAATKDARKACKTNHKNCKKQCSVR